VILDPDQVEAESLGAPRLRAHVLEVVGVRDGEDAELELPAVARLHAGDASGAGLEAW
jgi:hypothetical protein